MPENSGNRRHVHPNHLKERLCCRLEKENIVQSPKSVPSVNQSLMRVFATPDIDFRRLTPESVELTFHMPKGSVDSFRKQLTDLTGGTVEPELLDERWFRN